MRKQILKGVTMSMVVVAVGFMMAVASANAQSSTVVAKVPFEFTVGDRPLPAGEYSLKAMTPGAEALAIRNQDSNRTAIRLTQTIVTGKAPKKTMLVFHRYGQQYFLCQVWRAGDSTGRELIKSKAERTIQRQLAAIPSNSDLCTKQL
jgi:hypothetical protein